MEKTTQTTVNIGCQVWMGVENTPSLLGAFADAARKPPPHPTGYLFRSQKPRQPLQESISQA